MGKALLESRYPVQMDQIDLTRIHKFDLTYEETPMTIPTSHRLGVIQGDYFNGPWTNNKWPNPRIAKIGKNDYCYVKTGELLTENDRALEHRMYLSGTLGWSSDQINRWVAGDYEPMQTTRVSDVQRMIKRLRKWHRKYRSAESPLRFLWATEYGGVTDRPHAHLIVWGLHPDDATKVHDFWEGYQHGEARNGHVHPYRRDCTLNLASVVKGGAEPYTVKDVPKSRHLTHGNPTIYEQETPRVCGSKSPPIGDGAYPKWLEEQVQPALCKYARKSHWKGEELEVMLTLGLRKIYSVVGVHLGDDDKGRPKYERYPTSERWRDRCRADLGIDDAAWLKATEIQEMTNANETHELRTDGELSELWQSNLEQLRERSREILERDEERKRNKRAELIAAGKLRPVA